jgi:uncharacterized NAD(P)/FAD-binding protein YdhS
MTIHQMVGRLDGNGGFSIIETDNPMDLADRVVIATGHSAANIAAPETRCL